MNMIAKEFAPSKMQETGLLAQHDAICDLFVAPLGRLAGLRSQMAGISAMSMAFKIDQNHNRMQMRDALTAFFTAGHPERTTAYFSKEDHNGDIDYQICVMSSAINGQLIAFVRFQDNGKMTPSNLSIGYFDESCVAGIKMLLAKYMPRSEYTITHLEISDGNITSSTYRMTEDDIKLYPEFYPFIEGGVSEVISDFFEAKESLLILTGVAGSGKSSLYKSMLKYGGEREFYLVDNPAVYQDPALFTQLIGSLRTKANSKPIVVALEEVDAFVKEKTSDNTTLPRLLNLSAGAVKANIKFVLMSNIPTAAQFSEALVRDGRTYRAIDFVKLTPDEASAARAAIGLPPVSFTGEQVLATALKKSTKGVSGAPIRRVGF